MKKYYAELHIKRNRVIAKGKPKWEAREGLFLWLEIKNAVLKPLRFIRDIFFFEVNKGKVIETIAESYFSIDTLGKLRKKRGPKPGEKKLISLSIITEELKNK